MKYEPHEYQRYVINYIEDHPFAAVLLDMGLGKTSITLTAIADLLFDSFEVHKVLVIAPLRVARDTWSAELQKWDQLHHLTYSVAVGSEAERKAALTKKADIYIINRENVQWLIEKSKLPFDYDMVVVDELSSFKNHQSKRFKALMQVRPRIKRVVGLTGTPASNGLMDFDLCLTGFDEKELASFFGDETETQDDDFDVDGELEKPCITKAGDLWLLGNHRLVCGDSTKPETYELLMDGKKANLTVTDPPYNVNYEGSAGKIKNDNLENEKFYQFLLDAFTCMEKAMANDASIYVFHADTEGLNFRKAFADAGFYLSGTCIWKKQSLVLGRSPYQWQHEPCLFGWKKNGKHQWYSDRKQTTIWEFDKPKKNGDHPTMKPIPIIAYPIKNSSMSNCIVLDPFGGSGSTLIACEQTNRICHTIELDEKFCDVIVKRYIEQVGSADGVFVVRDGMTVAYSELEVSDEK